MKLVIDLEGTYGCDDASMATLIRDTVRQEIDRFYRSLVREALKAQEAQAREAIKKAASRDWKKVAAFVASLEETNA